MENNEKFRGQTNGVILFVLLSGDRHTDELKEIIDEKFSLVKIGTLYSIIARMKNQGHISEYRASSNDGSRRKYYKITELGKSYFDEQFSHLFIDVEPIFVEKNEPKNEEIDSPINFEENSFEEEEDVYLKYIKKTEELIENEEEPVDFSAVEEPKNEEIAPTVSNLIDDAPLFVDYNDVSYEKEVDLDSVVSSNYEYKSVLSKLFPKSKVVDSVPFDKIQNTQEENANDSSVQQENTTDLESLFEISERENIKIRTSVDTNRYQGARILVSKLRFHTAILTFILAVLEFLIASFALSGSSKFNSTAFITVLIIFGSVVILTGVIYAIKYNYSVKDLPKLINSIEIAIILAIGIVIVSICIASIGGIDLYDFSQVFSSIILPTLMATNIPVYVLISHFLSKLDFYQAI